MLLNTKKIDNVGDLPPKHMSSRKLDQHKSHDNITTKSATYILAVNLLHYAADHQVQLFFVGQIIYFVYCAYTFVLA